MSVGKLMVIAGISISTAAACSNGSGNQRGALEGSTVASAVTSDDILSWSKLPNNPAAAAAQERLAKSWSSMSFEAFYNVMRQQATNAPMTINGVTFQGAKNLLEANHQAFLDLGARFASFEDMWAKMGGVPATFSAADIDRGLKAMLTPSASAKGAGMGLLEVYEVGGDAAAAGNCEGEKSTYLDIVPGLTEKLIYGSARQQLEGNTISDMYGSRSSQSRPIPIAGGKATDALAYIALHYPGFHHYIANCWRSTLTDGSNVEPVGGSGYTTMGWDAEAAGKPQVF